VEVPGLSVSSFIRSAIEQRTGKRPLLFKFRKELDSKMDALHIERSYAERDLNVGFSGGEKKKAEILQLHMLAPSLAILDETDSGLDVDALSVVSKGIEAYRQDCDGSLLIITHNTRILERLTVDRTHVMVQGRMVAEGPGSLIDDIDAHGFEQFERAGEDGGAA
jgi:Fe-S cluster assembly ATP-binding protein